MFLLHLYWINSSFCTNTHTLFVCYVCACAHMSVEILFCFVLIKQFCLCIWANSDYVFVCVRTTHTVWLENLAWGIYIAHTVALICDVLRFERCELCYVSSNSWISLDLCMGKSLLGPTASPVRISQQFPRDRYDMGSKCQIDESDPHNRLFFPPLRAAPSAAKQ